MRGQRIRRARAKNVAITRMPTPYSAMESQHCSDRTALV